MATAMRKRKPPSRMILSQRLGERERQSLKPQLQSRQKDSRNENRPFGGMNQKDPNLRGRNLVRARGRVTEKDGMMRRSDKAEQDSPRNRKDRPLFHALKMQSTLTPVSYSHRDAIKAKIEGLDAFEKFDLLPSVCEAIYKQAFPQMTNIEPTPIQRLALPALLSQKARNPSVSKEGDNKTFDQYLLAAETGSGKTLAYLLPVIDAVKRQEVRDREQAAEKKAKEEKEKELRKNVFELEPPPLDPSKTPDSAMGRPRGIILLPTSELVTQVGSISKLLSHTIKFRSASISSIYSPTVIRNRIFSPNGIDVLVATPHLISSIGENDPNIFSRVQHLVVDEADSLLDRSFSPITSTIIDKCSPSLKQLVLCSATIPKNLDSFLDKRFPSIRRLVTPKVHSIPRRVQLGVIDIDKDPYRGNRDLACANTIWTIGKATHEDTRSHHTIKSMLVFVNEREKASTLAEYLSSKGIDAVALTRDTSESRQREILATFTSTERVEGQLKQSARDFIPFDKLSSKTSGASGQRHLDDTKVLVTTDLGSRGIDTLAVRHVILYDVPHSTIDFVHRLGRTGRMGRRGRGIVLVGKHDRKDVIREVKEAMFKGQALI
ncbi:MAG: hypothetical protein Q9227_003197 [Pyrenula ochraceoflavens]